MKKRILVVEDDSVVAKDIESILKKHKYKVIGTAGTTRKALQLFDPVKTDLLLCDINLGKGGSGIDLVNSLRVIKSDLLVVYLSAYTDDKTTAHAFGTDPAAYITKPLSEEQLIITIKRLFRKVENSQIKNKSKKPTNREKQIIKCIANGLTSLEIADELGIAFETVQTHRKNLLSKYDLHSSAELITFSIKNGWID